MNHRESGSKLKIQQRSDRKYMQRRYTPGWLAKKRNNHTVFQYTYADKGFEHQSPSIQLQRRYQSNKLY